MGFVSLVGMRRLCLGISVAVELHNSLKWDDEPSFSFACNFIQSTVTMSSLFFHTLISAMRASACS